MKYILVLLIPFLSLFSFGQNIKSLVNQKNDQTDSLKLVLKNNSEWRLIYNSIVKHYHLRNTDSVDYYTKKLFASKNNQIHDSLRVTVGAISASLKKEETDALKFLNLTELTLLKSKKNRNLLAWNYYYKADWYYNNFENKKALNYYFKADSVFSSINRKSFVSLMTKVGICDVLMKSGFDNKPLIIDQVTPYVEDGLRVSDSLGHSVPSAIFLYKKGDLYLAKGDLENSEKFYKKSLKISEKINNDIRQSLIFSRLAKIFINKNILDSAIVYQEKAVKKAKDIEDFVVVSEVNLELGILYNKIKNYNEAIKHLDFAKFNFEKSKSTRKELYQDIEYNLAEAYFAKKEFKHGYLYLKSAKNSMQEAQQIKNAERVEEIVAKYQTEKKEQEITLLKSEKALNEQKQKSQRNLLFGGLGLTTIAGFFLFFLYRNRQKTNTKLKELDKAKSNFFANISHEFRTPLTLITNPIDEALDDDLLSDKKREQFVMAKRNSDRLLSLVNQLLDLSKIDAGKLKLHIQKGNIQNIISGIAESFVYSAKQNNVNFHLEIEKNDDASWFDKDALEKITVNLLSNTIKYTPSLGSITCKSYIENNTLHFSIKNTGVGLTKYELDNVFSRFYKTDEQNQGTGIGLALVKELVELHKGIVKVDSKLNDWIRFYVILPIDEKSFKNEEFVNSSEDITTIKKPYINAFEEIDEAFEDNDKPILLIVEDNIDVRTLLKQTFEADYNILTAENGQIGIDVALEQIPDIIISDIMMPVKDGVALIKVLKNNELTSHIPIILLTAKSGDKYEIEGIEIGADDYITKPFNTKLLKTKVSNLIAIRRKLQSRYSQEIILTPKDIAITNLDEQFLNKVQEVLKNKLIESSFNVEDFSKAVGMSRMQLHRKIKALTSLSASDFVRSQRLKLAAELLKTSDINISQVGYSVGFSDHSYFAKCFKDVYHCTPTEFAKRS